VIWARAAEFLPLAFVLGAFLAALRHEQMEAIQRAAVRATAKIALGILIGCAVLQAAMWCFQD
jgi:hypothetical protein